MSRTPEPRPRGDVAALRIHREEAERRRSGVGRSAVVWIVILSVLMISALLGYERWIAPRRYPLVETMRVRAGANVGGAPLLSATGYLVADRQAVLAPKVAGRVAQVSFDVGSKVAAGQPLAVIESDQLQAQLREAEAVYNDAAKEYRRQRSLFHDGVTSRANLDAADASMKVAEARKAQVEVMLRDTVVVAPFSGTVIAKNTEVGEIVSPVSYVPAGTASTQTSASSIATVSDLSTLEVEADVNEGNVGRLVPGAPAEISVDAFPGRKWQGTLRKIIPSADRSKGVVKVRVAILGEKAGLVPDMSSTVSFLEKARAEAQAPSQSNIWIPAEAVINDPAGARVMVVDEQNRVNPRPVAVGQSGAGRIEIRSGIKEGERIVTVDPDSLTAGQRVRLGK